MRNIKVAAIFVLGLLDAGATQAQNVQPWDMNTGDGGPIHASQYGPPLAVGKAPSPRGYTAVSPPAAYRNYVQDHRVSKHNHARRHANLSARD
jgi:hypothetical protein